MFNRKISSLIAIILILALSLCLFSCSKKPSEKSFKEAQRESVEEFVDNFKKGTERFFELDYNDISVKNDISVSLSDEILTMLRSSIGEDMSWLNDLKITSLQNHKDGNLSASFGLNYNTNSLIALEAILSATDNSAYIALPALTSKLLKLDLTGENETAAIFNFATSAKVKDFLPDADTLGNVVLRYYDILMNAFTNISFTEGSLTVGDLSTECIVYTATLTRAEVMALVLNILETVKADEDINAYVKKIADFAESSSTDGTTADEVYAEYVSALDEAIEEIKTSDIENTELEAFKWTSYVTKKNDILATSFDFLDDEESYTFFTGRVQDGENIATQVYLAENGTRILELEGKLTEKKDKQTGTYEISSEGKSMLFIDIADLDMKKLEEGLISGSFTICPSKGLIDKITEEMDSDSAAVSIAGLTIASLSFKLDVDQKNANSASMTFAILNSGKPYISISASSTVAKGGEITVPSENNLVTDAEAWASSLDLNAFLENLENSGLPSFVIDLVSQYIMMLMYGASPF